MILRRKIFFYFVVFAFVWVACAKKNEDLAIDGYHTSNEVAASDLVAYWNFNRDNVEFFTARFASITRETIVPLKGQIGDAIRLDGATMAYSLISNLNKADGLPDFTISLWLKIQGQKGINNAFTPIFSLVASNSTDGWGNIVFGAETGHYKPQSDTLELRAVITTPTGTREENISKPNGSKGSWFLGANKWSHVVARWNSTTHQLQIFGDGTSIGGFDDHPAMGALVISTPALVVIGGLGCSDLGFANAPPRSASNPFASFAIDDLRVFNKALSDAEVLALFHLGKAGK